jgi:hypothetical protein
MGKSMENWHNQTVQGQRNTVVAKRMKSRAERAFTDWNKGRKKDGLEPVNLKKNRRKNRG